MITTTKSPTPFRVLALAATVAVTLAACGGSDSSDAGGNAETTVAAGAETTVAAETTAPETTAPAEPVTADQLTVESGFTSGVTGIGVRATSVGAVITNTAASTACGATVQFTLLDASGKELDSQAARVPAIAAGATAAVVPNPLNTGDAEPASLEATVASVGTCIPALALSALETADVAIDADVKYVTGTVTNSTDTAVEATAISCVLRGTDKAIVGGAKSVLRDAIEPAASADFKVRLVWAPGTAAAADCTAAA